MSIKAEELSDMGGVPGPDEGGGCDHRLDDLAQIIRAYNDVTEKLQHSHETLKSEVVRLQVELASTNAKLQRSKRLAALGEMAAGIAHEIRNPLGAIHLYAGMLVEDLTNPDDQDDLSGSAEMAQKIAAAVRGLNAVVDDVLSFAKEHQPRPQAIVVGCVFDRAIDACAPAVDAGQIEVLRLDRSNGRDGLKVYADASQLHRAVANLIRNAADAMREGAQRGGEPTGVLTLDAQQEGEQTVMIVRDTGSGIASEDIDRIFNPFFTTRNTGTGLGLAIVHRIVDANCGAVSVHNDGGAVFELSLPSGAGITEEHHLEQIPQRVPGAELMGVVAGA